MQEFLFPALTGLTLVFAGVLVGYFLWFRDRSEQIMLSEQLATDNERLSAELAAHSSFVMELEDRNTRLDLKNTSMQQLCDDLMSSREKIQLRVNDLDSELNSARTKLDDAREQLTTESRNRAKNEENLHQLKQQYMDSIATLEANWKEKFISTDNALSHSKSEVDRFMSANEAMAEKLHQANADCAHLKSELQAQREIMDTAKANAAGLEKEHVSLESSLRSQIELINEARGKAAAALSAQNLAEDSLATNRLQVEELKTQLRELQSELAQQEQYRSRCEHLEMSMSLNAERIESLVGQRDDSLTKQQILQQEVNSLRIRTDNQMSALEQLRTQSAATEKRRQKNHTGLINQIHQLESTKTTLIEERDLLSEKLSTLEQQISAHQTKQTDQLGQLESTNQSLVEERQQLTEKLTALEQSRQADQTQRAEQLSQLESVNKNLASDREELLKKISSFERSLQQQAGLVNQLQQLESANQSLMQECTLLKEQSESHQQWQKQHDAALERVSDENANLVAKLSEFEKFDPQSLLSSDQYQMRINSVLEQRDGAFSEVDELKSQMKRLRQHAKSNEETIRSLRRERGAILMRNREHSDRYPRIHNESLDFSRADELASEYGGTTKLDPIRGHVFVEAPRRHDDLKLIHGVAEVLERKLNSFGIYTFKQIMEWDDAAIEEFSELLVFKDRIHRDDWQGQAASMYYAKNRAKNNKAA